MVTENTGDDGEHHGDDGDGAVLVVVRCEDGAGSVDDRRGSAGGLLVLRVGVGGEASPVVLVVARAVMVEHWTGF